MGQDVLKRYVKLRVKTSNYRVLYICANKSVNFLLFTSKSAILYISIFFDLYIFVLSKHLPHDKNTTILYFNLGYFSLNNLCKFSQSVISFFNIHPSLSASL